MRYYIRGWTKRKKVPVFSSMPDSDLNWCIEFAKNLALLNQHTALFSHVSIDEGNPAEAKFSFTVEK